VILQWGGYTIWPDLILNAQSGGGDPYIINNSFEPVFYLKENSDEDPKVYILNAGGKLYEPVDFISTHKRTDAIFKIPDGGTVEVNKDGSVDLDFYMFGDAIKYFNIRAGWQGEELKNSSRDPAILNLFRAAENRRK